MCTSIVSNRNKTMIGWNLDILDMEYQVVAEDDRVYIAIKDEKEGWLPLFGANHRGDFVAMPTCWPHDARSNPVSGTEPNIINLDIELLLENKTLQDIKQIAETSDITSVPGVTFQSQLSDHDGNVLQIVPGQGCNYIEKPKYSIMTNFSPFKGMTETHPWMGADRYETAINMLDSAKDDFDVTECFEVLKAVSQTVCPTVVSMVFDVEENAVYWCENREWGRIEKHHMNESERR
ncbi:MAG: hypothetical protein PHD70_14300 [Anaerostipes sp.]|jgi:hypothetical protein|nr:hypothetical protein [Anaerostipes sp.]